MKEDTIIGLILVGLFILALAISIPLLHEYQKHDVFCKTHGFEGVYSPISLEIYQCYRYELSPTGVGNITVKSGWIKK
jgi:hypothetical protein